MRRRGRDGDASTARRARAWTLATAVKFTALRLFASGFLLARVESPSRATARPDAARAIVDKAVVLVVDGARHDWTTATRAEGDEARRRLKLPSARRYGGGGRCEDATNERGRGMVFKFIADAPTTTQQRLKGLLTGGLPTFIDASASFGGTTLGEDNLIEQLSANGRRMAISGDDTWSELFDVNATFRAGAAMYPSFDVKDTETVDAGVRASMAAALRAPDDWDVLIGHMLGADHVGHTHGATTDFMRAKLEENDRDIENVVEAMRADEKYADAMVFVFGDHGMTDNGDHGGGTPEEVESFMLAYHPWAKGENCGNGDGEDDDDFPQIDFAPTMATLLGVPIPHGNLGKVNEKVFNLAHEGKRASGRGDVFAAYVRAMHANAEQIWTYVQSYGDGKTSPFGAEHTTRLAALMKVVRANKSVDTTEFVLDFMNEVAEVARAKWAQFGLLSMTVGFIALVVTLTAHAVLAYDKVDDACDGDLDLMIARVGVFMVILASVARLSNSFVVQEREMMQFLFATFIVAAMFGRFTRGQAGVLQSGCKCLFANGALYVLGVSWVKSDSTAIASPAIAVVIATCGLVVVIVALNAIRRHASMASYNGKLRVVDIASCAWLTVAIRSVQILVFKGEGIALARATYALSIAGAVANGIETSTRSPSANVARLLRVFILSVAPTIAMLAGPILGVAYVALTYVLYDGLLSLLVDASPRSKGTETVVASGLWLASTVVFFGGGHTCSFDGLHFAVAFTGFRKFNFYGMGFLLGFETWSGEIILAVAIPLFAFAMTQNEPYESFQRLTVRVSMKVALFRAFAATCAALCAFIHRRHLMVWAIFAPKFVFDAIGSTVADVCAIVAVASSFSRHPLERVKRE